MDPFVRLSLVMIHRRWWVVSIFLILVVGGMVLFGSNANNVVLPGGLIAVGSSSDRAASILTRDFQANADDILLVVFHSPSSTVNDPAYRSQVNAAVRIIRRQPHVQRVLTYFATHDPSLVSRDRHTSVVQIVLRGSEAQVQPTAAHLPAQLKGITLTHYTSGRPAVHGDTAQVSVDDLHRSEFITLPVVLILLLLVFRTVVAALIPLLLGISAIALTESAVDIIGSHTEVSVYALNVASIIGLGLAIDFSLIIISRYRQELQRHADVIDAITATMATAGRSITYSGLTVLLSMAICTVIMIQLSIVRSMSLAILITAAVALIAALTLLPAVLALLGHHIDALHILPARRQQPTGNAGFWYRFSRQIMARPWVWLVASLAVMLFIASPIRDIAVAGPNIQALPSSASSVQGTELLARVFGPGYVAPIQVVIRSPSGSVFNPGFLRGVQNLTADIAADPRVQGVQSLTTIARAAGIPPASLSLATIRATPALEASAVKLVNVASGANETVLNVIPRYSLYDARHEALVADLRDRIIPRASGLSGVTAYVGGQSAEFIDFRDAVYGRFPYVILAIMILVFIILAMFFQSVFLPIKAVLLNLLSIFATYGALTAIFIWGVGDRLLGFHAAGTMSVVTPVILFVILFALSTDYEVFMLSRVKEHYERSHDNTEAVATGLQNTAGVITAAGLILMFTFGSFATAQLVTVKEIGIGLAIGVLLDSTVVRVIMVPATMRLLGDWNWWMPAGMKRLLPELSEGPQPASETPPALLIPDSDEPAAYLRPIGGSCGVERIALPTAHPFRIGRDTSNDLQLFDKRVAGHHARVDYADGHLFLTDLGSRHKVFVNDQPVTAHRRVPIEPGDSIQITGLDDHRFALEPA